MAKVQSPYEKARDNFTRKRSSVDSLKCVLRKQFKSRLRDMRSKSVDAGRNFSNDVNESYRELVQSMQSLMENEAHKFDFVQPEDVINTLKDIQNELLQQVVNQEVIDYESFLQDEVDAIVHNLITCKICVQFSEKDICDNCSTCFAD